MKPPNYRLKILNKKTGRKNQSAGAGWNNPDGSISIVIDPGVCLSDNQEHIIFLFPINEKTKNDI